MSAPTRILGIDPGLRITGFGIIEIDGQHIHHIANGAIKTADGSVPERLGFIFREVSAVVREHHPDCMAIEEVFIPLQPHFLALHGLSKLLETIDLVARRLNDKLRLSGVVFCMYDGTTRLAAEVSNDVDAFFRPTKLIREAAARVADRAGVSQSWLNDAVKAFLSPRGDFHPYLDLPHLRVFVSRPEYLLAMKCASMRLGEEFQDLDDVRFLLRYLNVTSADEALEIVTRYFDEKQLLPKTRLALEELLSV